MATLRLQAYKGLLIQVENEILSEEAVSGYVSGKLDDLIQDGTIYEIAERAAALGDLIQLSYEGFVDGVAFEGGKDDAANLRLGSGQFIPGFEEQLVGTEKGTIKEINVTFPDPYHNEALAGKEAKFLCKIREVYEVLTPDVDDQLAQKHGYETVNEMVMAFAEEARLDHMKAMNDKLEEAIMEALIDQVAGEIPAQEIEEQLDTMLHEFSENLKANGMELEGYLEYAGVSKEDFRDSFRENAEKALRLDAALEQIMEAEQLTVSQEEIDAEFERMAAVYEFTVEELHLYMDEAGVADNLLRQKCMELVAETAEIRWE